jgi:hypothetical protein
MYTTKTKIYMEDFMPRNVVAIQNELLNVELLNVFYICVIHWCLHPCGTVHCIVDVLECSVPFIRLCCQHCIIAWTVFLSL